MQIGVPTQCMTGVQSECGDEHMPTMKYDDDWFFLPDSSGYCRSYLVGKIQTG